MEAGLHPQTEGSRCKPRSYVMLSSAVEQTASLVQFVWVGGYTGMKQPPSEPAGSCYVFVSSHGNRSSCGIPDFCFTQKNMYNLI